MHDVSPIQINQMPDFNRKDPVETDPKGINQNLRNQALHGFVGQSDMAKNQLKRDADFN